VRKSGKQKKSEEMVDPRRDKRQNGSDRQEEESPSEGKTSQVIMV